MNVTDLITQNVIENEGVWCPLTDGGEALVASGGNPEFVEKQRLLERKFRRANGILDNKDLPDSDSESIWREATIGTVLKNWRKITFVLAQFEAAVAALPQAQQIPLPPALPAEGSDQLPFTPGNALWLLNHSRRFRAQIFKYSLDDQTFDQNNIEVIEGS